MSFLFAYGIDDMHILKQSCYMWPRAIWGLSFPHWAEKKRKKHKKTFCQSETF